MLARAAQRLRICAADRPWARSLSLRLPRCYERRPPGGQCLLTLAGQNTHICPKSWDHSMCGLLQTITRCLRDRQFGWIWIEWILSNEIGPAAW